MSDLGPLGLTPGWVTGEDAAGLAGITPAAFRREVSRSALLRDARQMLGPLACYPEVVVEQWAAARRPRRRL